jgi:hypothetical protein
LQHLLREFGCGALADLETNTVSELKKHHYAVHASQ